MARRGLQRSGEGQGLGREGTRVYGRGRQAAETMVAGPGEGREPPPRPAFTVLPRRWVVERTFAWLSQNRRMSKDYERLAESSEAFVYVAMTRLMASRLARS